MAGDVGIEGVAGPNVGVKRKSGGRVTFTVNAKPVIIQFNLTYHFLSVSVSMSSFEVAGRKVTLTTPEMARMLADRNARTVNLRSRLYR